MGNAQENTTEDLSFKDTDNAFSFCSNKPQKLNQVEAFNHLK